MKLVHDSTQTEVHVGQNFTHDDRGTIRILTVTDIEKPRHAASSGYVSASENGEPFGRYYSSIYNMTWIDREDREGWPT